MRDRARNGEGIADRPSERRCVVRGGEMPRLANDLRGRPEGDAHHRHATGHGLDRHAAERFVPAGRKQEDRGTADLAREGGAG